MKYRNIIFSLYGTLADINTDESDPKLWESLSEFYSWQGAELDPYAIKTFYDEEVRKQLSDVRLSFHELLHVDMDVSRVFEALYRRGGLESPEYPLKETAEFFREKSVRYLGLRPGALDLLDRLEGDGFDLFLLCNAQSSYTLPDLKKLGIEDYFKGIYLSSDYKTAKPEKAFFDMLLRQEGLDKEETVMIGSDLSEDIEGAKEAEIDSIYVCPLDEIPIGQKIPSVFVVKSGALSEIADFLCE